MRPCSVFAMGSAALLRLCLSSGPGPRAEEACMQQTAAWVGDMKKMYRDLLSDALRSKTAAFTVFEERVVAGMGRVVAHPGYKLIRQKSMFNNRLCSYVNGLASLKETTLGRANSDAELRPCFTGSLAFLSLHTFELLKRRTGSGCSAPDQLGAPGGSGPAGGAFMGPANNAPPNPATGWHAASGLPMIIGYIDRLL